MQTNKEVQVSDRKYTGPGELNMKLIILLWNTVYKVR